jgi:hypothetical protein
MGSDVDALSLAYYFTGDSRYALHAAQLLRAWFIDPATRMNPNLTYSQAVPGRSQGRGEGIIDAARLVRVVEGVGLLAPSGALSEADQRGLESWFHSLVSWMQTSQQGGDEHAKDNNHGIWYDALTTEFALFAREPDIARRVIDPAPQQRFARQIAKDGSLPRELERTRSLHYSHFALEAAFNLAQLGECVGADLWHYQTQDGRGLRKALDFLLPYAGRESAWPYPEMPAHAEAGKPHDGGDSLFYGVFMRAAWVYRDPRYAAAAQKYLDAARNASVMLELLPYGAGMSGRNTKAESSRKPGIAPPS